MKWTSLQAMSTVYLLRHGLAAGGVPDSERALSPEGRAQAEAVGRRLTALLRLVGPVHASPARRCRETAEALAPGRVRVDERLGLDRPLEDLVELAREVAAGSVLVGHQPELLGLLAAWLPDGATAVLRLPPAALVGLERHPGGASLGLYLETPAPTEDGP